MGAARKLLTENYDTIEPSKWKENQDQELRDTQLFCSMLESRFITSITSERESILNLLSIYYTKIQTLSSLRTERILIESSINYDEFVYDKELTDETGIGF